MFSKEKEEKLKLWKSKRWPMTRYERAGYIHFNSNQQKNHISESTQCFMDVQSSGLIKCEWQIFFSPARGDYKMKVMVFKKKNGLKKKQKKHST